MKTTEAKLLSFIEKEAEGLLDGLLKVGAKPCTPRSLYRAVTRGIDPSVPLKPSGIPWLGDIPQHWDVRRIKYLLVQAQEKKNDPK